MKKFCKFFRKNSNFWEKWKNFANFFRKIRKK